MSILPSTITGEAPQIRALKSRVAHRDARFTGAARAWADFWIGGTMIPIAERWPGLLRRGKPFFVASTWRTSRGLRAAMTANARRILGDHSHDDSHTALCKAVLANFFDFICEIAGTSKDSYGGLEARIGEVVGRERYLEVRAHKRGAILVTAHLGAFESAVAALRRDEPRVHIVFRRDPMKRFERLRAAQRQRLGVIEAPVDDGLRVWANLRDALLNDEVVLMQGDRVMPGQSGVSLPFFNGHMLFPSGPVKLAMLTGAPLVPIFAPRRADGSVQIILEEPIHMSDRIGGGSDVEHALIQLAGIIERTVRAFPDQWLVLQRAFCEDQVMMNPDRCASACACDNQP
jgi:phosphatidylinositol dimannoside acyltransferase